MAIYKTATDTVRRIEEMIFLIRGQRVMLDLPTNQEALQMRSQFVTASRQREF